jgi:SAM-dependent methyltransferase
MHYSLTQTIRRLVPSTVSLTYNPVFKLLGNSITRVLELPFAEARNLPPNHLRVRVGTENRLVANFSYHRAVGNQMWLQWLASHLCAPDGDVMEIGCGCGRLALPLEGGWFNGTYLGVDVDAEMIEYCRHRFSPPRFSFVLSSQTSELYRSSGGERAQSWAPAQSRDFVFSLSLLSHLLEPQLREVVAQTSRILRKGGWAYMSFFALEYVRPNDRWTFEHPVGNARVESVKHPEAAVAYKEDFLRSIFQEDFRDIRVIGGHPQSEIVARK